MMPVEFFPDKTSFPKKNADGNEGVGTTNKPVSGNMINPINTPNSHAAPAGG